MLEGAVLLYFCEFVSHSVQIFGGWVAGTKRGVQY
jgi:hypothetical protein